MVKLLEFQSILKAQKQIDPYSSPVDPYNLGSFSHKQNTGSEMPQIFHIFLHNFQRSSNFQLKRSTGFLMTLKQRIFAKHKHLGILILNF